MATSVLEQSSTIFSKTFPNVDDVLPKFNIANFGVVVVQNPGTNQYLAVDESRNRGWWLPAGFIDAGESITVGSKRESVEEAGIDPKMLGILRIELSGNRCRTVYFAKPLDPEAIPKNFADSESNGAAWLTVKDLKKMARNKKSPQLRGPELLYWGTFLDENAPYPDIDFFISTYEDKNPTWIRSTGTNTTFSVKFILIHAESKTIYLEKQNEDCEARLFLKHIENERLLDKAYTWAPILIPKELKPDNSTTRVVRVYHSMRDNGGSMGFVFSVNISTIPSDGFVPVKVDNLSGINEQDQEILHYASQPGKLWNLQIITPEYEPVVAYSQPDTLFSVNKTQMTNLSENYSGTLI